MLPNLLPHSAHILNGDSVLGLNIGQIKHNQKNPLQRLHYKINYICGRFCFDHFRYRETVRIVNVSDKFMEFRSLLFQNLFECIRYAKLTVYNHAVAVTNAVSLRLDNFSVSSRCHGTKIMLIL